MFYIVNNPKVPVHICILIFCVLLDTVVNGHQSDDADVLSVGSQADFKFSAPATRYLIYDINPGEGFNLRRDVYIRVANLIRALNLDEFWTLVLPPWNRLYHWRSVVEQAQLPWSAFFDLDSFRRYIPVVEFVEFLNLTSPVREIEDVYYLQSYREGWKDGKWEEKIDVRECNEHNTFVQDIDGSWLWWFWDFKNVTARNFTCLSVQAQATSMKSFLIHRTHARSVFFVRAEQLIHGEFSEWSAQYWTARRSMRFSRHLRAIGDSFRLGHLNSDDVRDRTELSEDWRKMKRKHGDALGGPYVGVHLRRRDFLYSHRDDVPTLHTAAKQIEQALLKHNLTTVFLATDAPANEVSDLTALLADYHVVQYQAPDDVVALYKDGGVAIIDQWICAHARYFIGTSVSTFSFRIHEEREILGFDMNTTFNRFCPEDKPACEQPTKWKIIYD